MTRRLRAGRFRIRSTTIMCVASALPSTSMLTHARGLQARAHTYGCQSSSMEKPHREPVPEYCLAVGVVQPPKGVKSLKLGEPS